MILMKMHRMFSETTGQCEMRCSWGHACSSVVVDIALLMLPTDRSDEVAYGWPRR